MFVVDATIIIDAQAAIAANKGIAPAWVEGQAAVRGYRVEVDAEIFVFEMGDREGRFSDQIVQLGRAVREQPVARVQAQGGWA